MTVRTYLLTSTDLVLTNLTGPTLDAVSLQLPTGVYTTLRTYERNHILGLSAHLQRLVDSHRSLNKPRPLDLAAIRLALRSVIERENLSSLRLRLTTPFDSEEVYISVEPFTAFPPEYYTCGIRCATLCLERTVPAAKQTSFIAPSRSAKAGLAPDIHEVLILNNAGQIVEGISSNFFAVVAGTLYTAGEEVLAGITRQIVLAEAHGLLPISFNALEVTDLPRVAETFITSSGREVMPVRQIDEVIIGEPGPATRELSARYHMHIIKEAELP